MVVVPGLVVTSNDGEKLHVIVGRCRQAAPRRRGPMAAITSGAVPRAPREMARATRGRATCRKPPDAG